jgi:hypothetical protein
MRVLTVSCSREFGEMTSCKLAPEFSRESPLFRADVLKDLLEAVTEMYREAVADWTAELKQVRAEAGHAPEPDDAPDGASCGTRRR